MDDLGKVDVFSEDFLQVENDGFDLGKVKVEGFEKSLEDGKLENELGQFDASENDGFYLGKIKEEVENDGFDLVKIKEEVGNDGVDLEMVEIVEESLEVGGDGFDIGKIEVDKSSEVGGDEICKGSEIGHGEEKKVVGLGSLIAKEIGKVSLGGEMVASIESGNCHASNGILSIVDKENGSKTDDEENKDDSESESASSSSSSSSSSSDDDDDDDDDDEDEDDEETKKEEIDMEEGEIRDEMAAWSDDEDEIGGSIAAGPIRSKNEVQDLPPVPPVNVTMQPHHQTLPVGVVLSMIGSQVIVEGVEKHNPLSEGSILWITESKTPLGIIDEIFGPVKNPYYIVRYNSESEVPTGIQQGTLISFVPEFADYVLNNNNLYKKGYDASNEHDEELSDEIEFSDDEKEAKYKRMQKMSKRGKNDQKSGNMRNDKKKFKNRSGNWNNSNNNQNPSPTSQVPQNTIQQSPSQTNSSHAQGPVQGFTSGPGPSSAPTFQQVPQSVNFNAPSGVWTNGTPFVNPQNTGINFPNGLPTNMLWMQQQQNYIPQPFQMPMPNGIPFPQQFNPGQMMPPNFFQGQAFSPWPTNMGPNMFNQPQLAQGFQIPVTQPQLMNMQQGVFPDGPQMENNNGMRPPFTAVGGGNSGNSSGNLQQQGGMPNGVQVENRNNMRPPFTGGGGSNSGNLTQVGNSNNGGGPPFFGNVEQQGAMPNGTQVESSNGVRPPFTGGGGGGDNSGNFSQGGTHNRGGRQPFRGRGGGRFRGGRGGRQHRGGRS